MCRIQNFSCLEESHTRRRRNIVMTTIIEVRHLPSTLFSYFYNSFSLSRITIIIFPFLCQTMIILERLLIRKSTNQQTAPQHYPPPCPPTQQTQQWAFCRPSPPLWPQAQTQAPTCTKNPPIPLSPRTLPRTVNVKAAAAGAKGVTPLTLAPCRHHRPPPRSTPPLPRSHPSSTGELRKRSR